MYFSRPPHTEHAFFSTENLERLPAFKGLNIPKSAGGKIDPMQDLFRTDWPGVTAGPVVSQLLLSDFAIDSIVVPPKQVTLVKEMDYMTTFQDWLDVQVWEVVVDVVVLVVVVVGIFWSGVVANVGAVFAFGFESSSLSVQVSPPFRCS